MNPLNDSEEAAWVEGFVTALAEVRGIVDELLVRADSLIRGRKGQFIFARTDKALADSR